MMRRMLRFLTIALAATGVSIGAREETKETRMLRLQLNEAQLQVDNAVAQLKQAEARYREEQTLFERGLVNKVELATTERRFQEAKLDKEQKEILLERTRLQFLNRALLVTLERAAVFRDSRGNKRVSPTIKNSSDANRILDEKETYSADERRSLAAIDNIRVRIKIDNTLIGRPFEQRIPLLRCGESRQTEFVLQRDTESVTVEISFGDTVIALPVYLEKESKQDQVAIEAAPFSQEGELGSRVNYDLLLERYSEENKTYTLEIRNLPVGYSHEFREVGEGSGDQRVSTIRFAQSVTSKTIRLGVNLPKTINKDSLNTRIGFFVLVLDRYGQQRLGDELARRQGGATTAGFLDSVGISHIALELIPRGRAELAIGAPNLFVKSRMTEPVRYSFDIINTGTVSLDQVRIALSMPVNWTAIVNPERNITIDADSKKRVEVEIIPASDVVAGDYEVKVEAGTLHEGRSVDAQHKILRLRLEGKSNLLIGIVLMVLLVGMIAGVAVMTIRISRR